MYTNKMIDSGEGGHTLIFDKSDDSLEKILIYLGKIVHFYECREHRKELS